MLSGEENEAAEGEQQQLKSKERVAEAQTLWLRDRYRLEASRNEKSWLVAGNGRCAGGWDASVLRYLSEGDSERGRKEERSVYEVAWFLTGQELRICASVPALMWAGRAGWACSMWLLPVSW